MVLVIGEVLFDVFPDYRRIGGAPFNFAFHLHRLGEAVRFVSRIGFDDPGREVLAFVERWGLSAGGLQLDPEHPTGMVRVSLDEAAVPTFDILPDMAYDHIEINDTLQNLLSRRQPETRAFCDINLRPESYNDQVIRASLRQADVLKLSSEELQVLRGIVGGPADDRVLIDRLRREFDIAVLVLTHGAAGSAWHSRDGSFHLAPPPLADVVDTVGAGDAHAAMTALGYLRQWPPTKTLAAANRLAAAVCTIQGALPESEAFYAEMAPTAGG
jgi:fructokinase